MSIKAVDTDEKAILREAVFHPLFDIGVDRMSAPSICIPLIRLVAVLIVALATRRKLVSVAQAADVKAHCICPFLKWMETCFSPSHIITKWWSMPRYFASFIVALQKTFCQSNIRRFFHHRRLLQIPQF